MIRRIDCPPAPGPLEEYAAHFDDLFTQVAQRRVFRNYLAGLVLPRDRKKMLTRLAGVAPIVEAQEVPVQRLQFFLSESTWDAEAVNARRLELIWADAEIVLHDGDGLVIDETGDRKDGTKTAHVTHQYLGSVGKSANGIVAVTSSWTDGRAHYLLHVVPYTPAVRLPLGKKDAALRTKPQLMVDWVELARDLGLPMGPRAAPLARELADGRRAAHAPRRGVRGPMGKHAPGRRASVQDAKGRSRRHGLVSARAITSPTSSRAYVGGKPGRGVSRRPSSPAALNHLSHRRTARSFRRNSFAMAGTRQPDDAGALDRARYLQCAIGAGEWWSCMRRWSKGRDGACVDTSKMYVYLQYTTATDLLDGLLTVEEKLCAWF